MQLREDPAIQLVVNIPDKMNHTTLNILNGARLKWRELEGLVGVLPDNILNQVFTRWAKKIRQAPADKRASLSKEVIEACGVSAPPGADEDSDDEVLLDNYQFADEVEGMETAEEELVITGHITERAENQIVLRIRDYKVSRSERLPATPQFFLPYSLIPPVDRCIEFLEHFVSLRFKTAHPPFSSNLRDRFLLHELMPYLQSLRLSENFKSSIETDPSPWLASTQDQDCILMQQMLNQKFPQK